MAGPRIRDYKKINSPDELLNRVQDEVSNSISQLLRTEILDGRLIQNVTLTAGINSVEHRLDRPILGWMITRKRADANVWDSQDNNGIPTRFLDLNASADVVVDIWVF